MQKEDRINKDLNPNAAEQKTDSFVEVAKAFEEEDEVE